MTQTWDPQAYEQNGAFVHGLAGGVLEWLNAQMGEYILDLGCGDGQLTQRIAASGAHVLGVDASPSMVEAARERGIEAEQANAEMDFEDDAPDAERQAMFSQFVEHLSDDQRTVILRRFVEQQSVRGIAASLGRSEGAVKQLQFRALSALRARMEGADA